MAKAERQKPTNIMKAKIILFALILFTTILTLPPKAQAQEQAAGSSATFNDVLLKRVADNRAQILQMYLEAHHSPLAPYANVFVQQADLYHIDWRLVAAISGVESTFGNAVPCTNAWGWGIYTDHMYCFPSYPEAIQTISHDLRTKYIDEWGATNVWQIGDIYAASPTWAARVMYFMNDMQIFYDANNTNAGISSLTLQ